MKNRSLHIPLIYVVLGSLYYVVAAIVFQSRNKEFDSLAAELSQALSNVFFWAHTHVLFIFILMGSSLIGVLISYQKKALTHCRGFSYVFLFSALSFLVLLLSSLV